MGGRTRARERRSPDAPKVAVLSYSLWQRQFGGGAGAVGSSGRLNGESFMIAGILPPHFPLPLRDVDVVVPLVPDRDPNRYLRNSNLVSLALVRANGRRAELSIRVALGGTAPAPGTSAHGRVSTAYTDRQWARMDAGNLCSGSLHSLPSLPPRC
jgi:MacB-like periplasmic core domain